MGQDRKFRGSSHAEIVQGTRHALAPLLQDVGVDHGGSHIGVSEQLLNSADVGSALQQVGSKGMTKRMGADLLRQPRAAHRRLDGLVDDAGVKMMTTREAGARINGERPGRKNVLPAPVLGGGRDTCAPTHAEDTPHRIPAPDLVDAAF